MGIKPPTWREWKAQNDGKLVLVWPSAFCWLLRKFEHFLRQLPFFLLLEQFAVVAAVMFYFYEADDRAKEHTTAPGT